ncbi:hypothetical protein [Luteibacter sp.]|jgi:hypothetical protein|uniref:hypothetical protein n=1 Tax=Luteibacter sp. TaxID=1886636 RepID=UPI002F4289C5
MDVSAEWVMAWTDLILDSSAMSEAADQGDLVELRARACSIAARARRHGFAELSRKAFGLVDQLDFRRDLPISAHARPVQEIVRDVDAIGRTAG